MKLLVLFTVAALTVGGIYHTEVSQYFADLTEGSFNSGGAVGSMQGMGNSSNDLMGGVGNALDR